MKQEEIIRGKGRIKSKTFITEFNSTREMVEHNKNGKLNKVAFPTIPSSENGRYGFSKTHNYGEAEELMMNGWSAGAKQLNSSLKIANAKRQDKTVKRAINDVVGFQANVPRYLQGIPTNMINNKPIKRKQKVVTLCKAVNYSARVSADDILKDSVKFLQIVQVIEKQGTRVNVYVVFGAKEDNEQLFIKVKIKSANERLNISKMSFQLMHPSFLRRIVFKTMEVDGRLNNSWGFGYGMPLPKATMERYVKDNEHIIPVMITQNEAENIVNNIS